MNQGRVSEPDKKKPTGVKTAGLVLFSRGVSYDVRETNVTMGGLKILPPVRGMGARPSLAATSKVNPDSDISASQLGKRSRTCHQLREGLILGHCFLSLAVRFPARIARND